MMIVTRKRFHEAALIHNSDCDIRTYFPTARKSVENEGIQGKSIAIAMIFSTTSCIAIVTSQLCT